VRVLKGTIPLSSLTAKPSGNIDTLFSLALLGVLGIIVIPLPPLLLDLLLAINLGTAVLLLLVTLGARHPLELSAFPSLLLLLTLYRLALNVATTRSILLAGVGGQLVQTFGELVVGGNLVVGLVIFLILVLIQFIVITKGAGRVSEVAARFTLDALPGKQMAIDAELNAGSIDEATARRRRQQLSLETEFYGAMDGAGKFVRGDAIAGLIITAVNLVGGVLVGFSHGMQPLEAVRTYGVLTVGDGLASQIPALFIATASGILITKSSSEGSLGEDIAGQLSRQSGPLWLGASVLALAGLMPGMPTIPLLALSGGLVWWLRRDAPEPSAPATSSGVPAESTVQMAPTNSLDEFLQVDRAAVEVGARLVSLLTNQQGRPFAHRITLLRRDISRQRGVWIPEVRVRSNLELPVDGYRILIAGREVAAGTIQVHRHLVMLSDSAAASLPGEDALDPVFRLPARWISEELASVATARGLTAIDGPSVLLTHLGEVLKEHAHELLTRDHVKAMLDEVQQYAPTIVAEIRGGLVSAALLHQVLQQLVRDGVPLADLALVLEAVANQAGTARTPDDLTDAVRASLGQLVCSRYCDVQGTLRIIAFEPRAETRLREAVREGHLALDPAALSSLLEVVAGNVRPVLQEQQPVALLCDRGLRRPLRNLLQRELQTLGFLAFQEVPAELTINPLAIITLEQIWKPQPAGAAHSNRHQARAA
jgi:flagellar biosynthesis protein FlhA